MVYELSGAPPTGYHSSFQGSNILSTAVTAQPPHITLINTDGVNGSSGGPFTLKAMMAGPNSSSNYTCVRKAEMLLLSCDSLLGCRFVHSFVRDKCHLLNMLPRKQPQHGLLEKANIHY